MKHEVLAEGIEIYQGDCQDVMKGMQDEIIDLTVTSPPYDNLRAYNGYTFDFEGIAKQLYRLTKPGGVVVWVVGDATINGSETGTSFRQALYFMEIGFRLHDTEIYRKKNYIPLTHNRYEQAFEFMFVFSKGNPKTFNPIMEPTKGAGNKYNLARKRYSKTIKEGAQRRRNEITTTKSEKIKSNIFSYACGSSRSNHPAPFPKDLPKDQIISWSSPGDLILDPLCGSGTTGMGAVKLSRNFIGIDISEEYINLTRKRIKEALMQPRLL